MIDKTQRKLREAEFFYRRLHEVFERKWMNEPEAFRHFFSAFIQAARSVQWVLQSEQKQKYDAWHPAWESQLKPDDRKLLKLTATLRNEEAKEGGRDPLVELEEITFNEMLGLHRERGHPAHHQMPPQGPLSLGAKPVSFHREKHYFEDAGNREEVMTVCKQYLIYLEKLVQDFLSAHATP